MVQSQEYFPPMFMPGELGLSVCASSATRAFVLPAGRSLP